MASVGNAIGMAKLCSSYSHSQHRLSNLGKKKVVSSPKFILTSFSNLRAASPPPIHATNSPSEHEPSSDEIIPQEDVMYLCKLGIGSVAAAAFIKYGCVFFPQITTPNLLFALLLISTPVFLSTFILINKSRSN
ncbi:hypothetical protein M5689_021441 [Euphorbia peplus]|nr:hypothetical protein M5689_021441 [Euphorbia peplus]